MAFENITEQSSHYTSLDEMSVSEILNGINQEDQTVPHAVAKVIPQIEKSIAAIVPRMKEGGRLFYIGAGTSGRLGVLDASECPPTFGVDFNKVIGIIAGGDGAIRKAVENAEDNSQQAWLDLQEFNISSKDVLIGIAASGRTPYVVGGLKDAQANGIFTACICCNPGSPVTDFADVPIVAIVGPEFLTGSSRMKAGTAQKLILNMITTTTMIQLGHVKGNKMIDMKLSNEKLVDRGIRMVAEELSISYQEAQNLIEKHGDIRKAIENFR